MFYQLYLEKETISRIRKRMSLNTSNHIFLTVITVNKEKIANPTYNANVFSNYFAKVAIDIQSFIRFSKIIPIYKKGSNVQTIGQFLCYLILRKFWEDLCITNFTTFQKKKKSYFHSNLVSTTHALIHLTDEIRDEIVKSNYVCGILVTFKRPLIQQITIYY